MDETLEALSCLEHYPMDFAQEQPITPRFLAGLISNADDLFRTTTSLQKERLSLETHVNALQAKVKEMTTELQRERELRQRCETELKDHRASNSDLENQVMNHSSMLKQTEATLELKVLNREEKVMSVLRDVTKAYLFQYEYLRHRRVFKNEIRMPWKTINMRLRAMEGLKEVCAEHDAKMRKHKFPEMKDTGSQVMVMKQTMGTNTEAEEQGPVAIGPSPKETAEIGVNTTAPNRVTRATQATERKGKSVDRSSMCNLLQPPSPNVPLEDEELSLDLAEIFKSTICKLPAVLEEIEDLVLPKVSSSCQTEDSLSLVRRKSTSTLTDLSNISRKIDYKSRRARDEAVKHELSNEGESLSLNRRALQQFQEYWSLAGQSLISAMEVKPKREVPGSPNLDFLLQQQMVAKFITEIGEVPVKKAVSIPSIYAESTKSGFEKDDDEEDFLRGRRSAATTPMRTSSEDRTFNENSLDSSCGREEVERAVSASESEHEDDNGQAGEVLPIETIVRPSPSQINSQKPRVCAKRKLVINRTVNRILRERTMAFKIRPTGEKRLSQPPRKPAVQLKRIRLVKQKDVPLEQKMRLDSESSEVNEDSMRDCPSDSEVVKPILDGDKIRKLGDDLYLSDTDEEEEKQQSDEPSEGGVEMEGLNADQEVIPQNTESMDQENETPEQMESCKDYPTTTNEDDFDSPSSPQPSKTSEDTEHQPKVIPTERQVVKSANHKFINNCLQSLRLTHTTLNQFIQNYSPLPATPRSLSKMENLQTMKILSTYLDSEWTSQSLAECVHAFTELIRGDGGREKAVVQIILRTMEHCPDDLNFEPFNCLAPFMPKTHQMVVLLVERLNLNQKMIASIEEGLFTFQLDVVNMQRIINWTYLYLSLQDLQINKERRSSRPLRLFLVKALYYMKRRSIFVIFLALKAFPKLLPRLESKPFVVGDHVDPLVDVLICVLMNSKEIQCTGNGVATGKIDREFKTLAKYRADWKKLQHFYYGYTQFTPNPEEVLRMLLNRLRNPQREWNVVQGLLLLAKHMNVEWTQQELLLKELMPRVNELMDMTGGLSKEAEDELCRNLTVIAGVVKVFPRTEDVSAYRNIFRRVLLEKERFSHKVQECAVISILRLHSSSKEAAFNAIKDWYAPPEMLSPQLRAVMETFVRRGEPEFWVQLSNQV